MRGAGQREEPSKLRSLTYRITILSLGLFGRGRLLWRHVPPKISAVAISLSTGVALALIFAFQPSPLEEAKSVSTPQLFVALATLIATMLVLSITLAMIPIQRAVEAFTPAIATIYRRDRPTEAGILFLGLAAVLALYLASGPLPTRLAHFQFAMALAGLAVALDVTRFLARRTSALISPLEAVKRLESLATRSLARHIRAVHRRARLQHFLLVTDSDVPLQTVQTAWHTLAAAGEQPILRFISELGQLAEAGSRGGQRHVTEAALGAVTNITARYLHERRDDIFLSPAPQAFLVLTSDAHRVLVPACEAIQKVNRVAVSNGDESSAIQVLRALVKLAISAGAIDGPHDGLRDEVTEFLSPPFHAVNCKWVVFSSKIGDQTAAELRDLHAFVHEGGRPVEHT